MDESRSILRLKLDGMWSAEELGRILVSLSDLYALRLFLELLREDTIEWMRYLPEFGRFRLSLRGPSKRRPFPAPFLYWPSPPPLSEGDLSRISQIVEPEMRMEIRRINYASPGIADLAGVGAVIGHVKDFVLKLIERKDQRRSRELSEERAELENDRLRLENARNFVTLVMDMGYTKKRNSRACSPRRSETRPYADSY
jgi:hypothetical protein